MTEYAHNHPPRCCCESQPGGAMINTCPQCHEHGELAQLGNDNSPNSIPANVTPHTDYEYACCHQLVGRPHTDYCPRHPWNDPTKTAAQIEADHGPTPTGLTPEQAAAHVAAGMHTAPARVTQPPLDSWPTHTTQAPAHTSQPATHTRNSEVFAGWHHPTNGTTPHALTNCTPACNQPTPLAAPTPAGVCHSCGCDYQRTPVDCATPERHDHPR